MKEEIVDISFLSFCQSKNCFINNSNADTKRSSLVFLTEENFASKHNEEIFIVWKAARKFLLRSSLQISSNSILYMITLVENMKQTV